MMTFPIFLIACLNAFIFWQLLDYFKPQIKAFGLRWTYHAQAFFEIHFYQIEDIKRRDRIKNKVTVVQEVRAVDAPRAWRWEVKTHNVENKEYETIEIIDNLLESKK
jgi:hypothetical protein